MARELSIRITADNSDAHAKLGQTEQDIHGVEGAATRTGKAIGTASDGPGTPSVVGSFKALTTTLATIGAGEATRAVIAYGSHLQDLKAKSGIGIEGLSNLDFAAGQVGLTLDDAVDGIVQIQRRLADGDKSAVGAVRALGLSVDDLVAKKPDQMFIDIATKISEIPAKGDQLVAAYDLMGKSGTKLVPLITDIESLKATHLQMTDESVAALDRLDDFWNSTVTNVKIALGLILGEIVDTWTVKVPAIWEFAKTSLADLYSSAKGWLVDKWTAITDGVKAATGLVLGYVESLATDTVEAVTTLYAGAKSWLVDKWTDITSGVQGVTGDILGFVAGLATDAVAAATSLYTGAKTWLVDKFVDISDGVQGFTEDVLGFFSDLSEDAIASATGLYEGAKTWLVDKFEDISDGVEGFASEVLGFFSDLSRDVIAAVTSLYQGGKKWLLDSMVTLSQSIKTQVIDRIVGFFLSAKTTIVTYAQQLYTGVKTWLVDRFTDIVNGIKAKIDAVTGFFSDLYDKVVGHSFVPDMIKGIQREFDKLPAVMVDPAGRAADATSDHFRRAKDLSLGYLDDLLGGIRAKWNETSLTDLLVHPVDTLKGLLDAAWGAVQKLVIDWIDDMLAQALSLFSKFIENSIIKKVLSLFGLPGGIQVPTPGSPTPGVPNPGGGLPNPLPGGQTMALSAPVSPLVAALAPAGPSASAPTSVHVTIQAWDGASVDRWLRTGGDRQIVRAIVPAALTYVRR